MRTLLGNALIAISAILFSQITYGHQLTEIRGRPLSDALLPNIKTAKSLAKKNKAVVWAAYRINEIGPLNDDEKDEETVARVIRYSLHRDLPITGNEDGYDFMTLTQPADPSTLQLLAAQMPELANEQNGLGVAKFTDVLTRSLDRNLWVYIGHGSGENTSAEILVTFDSATNEYVYVINSNFGLGPAKHRRK